jgi:23S rRNA (pseudouridine1915-N3)-methyltransferase
MKLHVAWIQSRPGKDKSSATHSLTNEYIARIKRYQPTTTHELGNEEALLKLCAKSGARSTPMLILLDPRGKQMTSEEFAAWLNTHMDRGTQSLLFAVGGADGFSDITRKAATQQIALGKMTLPHELARVVLLEQIYRAFTIMKGHPYHTGH